MGFFTGRVSFLRFAVQGEAPRQFDDEHLNQLREHVAGRQAIAAADGVEAGWAAGKSVLDLEFDLEKNIINDALHFDLRVDTDRLPGDLLKAYYEADLAALASRSGRRRRARRTGLRRRPRTGGSNGASVSRYSGTGRPTRYCSGPPPRPRRTGSRNCSLAPSATLWNCSRRVVKPSE
jgi:hypothetical protein